MTELGRVLLGPAVVPSTAWTIEVAVDRAGELAYRQLRRDVFIDEQGLFADSDLDHIDEDPRRVVLIARDHSGTVVGGVRLAPATADTDLGWWCGSRLAVARDARHTGGIGPALVRAAGAHALSRGVLRFEATVQPANAAMFGRLGWSRVRDTEVAGRPHVLMLAGNTRFADLVAATKSELGPLLGFVQPGAGFVGDDGAPVPGSDLIAACDAIVPSMVERDPYWAGWCSVLVNVNDLTAMGATPVGLLDAVAARDASFAARILAGLREASVAYGVPVLGGHTQLGVPAALSVTALGRTDKPIPAGGGRPGQHISLTADLEGQWRPGYTGRQWDSTTSRTAAELRSLQAILPLHRPAAAKDVSMAGLVGTLGMLAEASGCGATLDVGAIPRPDGAAMGDWLTCFPGFAMLSADEPGRTITPAAPAISARCGELTTGAGVRLSWPDGELTEAVPGPVTGMGTA